MVALDSRFLHRFVVRESWSGWIPVVYSGLAACALLVSLAGWAAARRFAAYVCLSSLLVGGVGTYFHTRGNFAEMARVLDMDAPRPAKPPGSTRATSSFAPLALTGLGLVGFVLVWPGARAPKPRLATQDRDQEAESKLHEPFRWPDAA